MENLDKQINLIVESIGIDRDHERFKRFESDYTGDWFKIHEVIKHAQRHGLVRPADG